MGEEREPPMSREDMKAHKIPLVYRDYCANLAVSLHECRKANAYMPWACGHERHAYEICQYEEYQRRVQKLKQQKAAAGK